MRYCVLRSPRWNKNKIPLDNLHQTAMLSCCKNIKKKNSFFAYVLHFCSIRQRQHSSTGHVNGSGERRRTATQKRNSCSGICVFSAVSSYVMSCRSCLRHMYCRLCASHDAGGPESADAFPRTVPWKYNLDIQGPGDSGEKLWSDAKTSACVYFLVAVDAVQQWIYNGWWWTPCPETRVSIQSIKVECSLFHIMLPKVIFVLDIISPSR